MAQVDDNRDLVVGFYGLMSQQRFEDMFALMADDATWTVAGDPATFHHAGTATKAQRETAFRSFTQVFTALDMEVRSTTAQDDRVAAELITRCETHAGLRYVNELMVLIRCREGRIASIYEHLDQQTALAFDAALKASLAAGDD